MKVAGIGFRTTASLDSLRAALTAAEARGGRVDALATTPHKAAALRHFAQEQGLFLYAVDVAGVPTPTQSPRIRRSFGTGSVSEAAALVAAGPGARIVVARMTSPDGLATAAIAASADEIMKGAAK
ncbi:MAG: cobalamin biosynthesis protein [Paracoccaceae bacterium]|nr:cobalamin biosynthesis protein [Paracoccaceae bacterium]